MRLLPGAVLGLALLAAAVAEENPELLRNGGFEEGAAGATLIPGWTEVDGLTTFFPVLPGRGRVLLIDTDVNLVEADERWKELELPVDKRPAARPKGPTREPKYDTVGGTTGAKIFSDYLRVSPDVRYRLRADVKSDGPVVMIFVKGYAEFQGGYRKFYQWYKNVNEPTGEWKTWEGTFNPTLRSPKVTHIRVMPYAYWPAGPAWIDNVSVTPLGREEPRAEPEPDGLLENGDFSRPGLDPWTAEGDAERADLGGEASCGRVRAGGALVSPRVVAPEGRSLRVRARVRVRDSVLEVTAEGVLRWEGEWTALSKKTVTVPAESDDWTDVDFLVNPGAKAPQVTHLRLRFRALGERGFALVDDVSVAPAPDGEAR